MNNNFTGGSINHGNGWTTTHDPRGDIRHYTGEQHNATPSISHSFQAGHNSSYTGRHRSGTKGTNRYEMQKKWREQRERAEAEEARIKAEQEVHRRKEEAARQAQEAELRRLEHEKFCAEHPLEGAQKWVNEAINHINAMEHTKNHAEHLVRESEAMVNRLQGEIQQAQENMRQEVEKTPRGFTRNGPRARVAAKHNEHIGRLQNELAHHQNELQQRIAHRDHCYHQLHEAHQNKSLAETNLNHIQNNIRQQQEAHAVHIAKLEAARLQEQQEAKKKADEAAEAQHQIAEATKQLDAQIKADEAVRAKEQEVARQKAEEASKIVKDLIATRSVENNYLDTVANQFSSLDILPQAAQPADQDGAGKAGQPSGIPVSNIETQKIANSSFSSKQVLDLHKELEAAKKTGADTKGIYEKYAAISQKNREQLLAEECPKNPFCVIGAQAEMEGGDSIATTIKRFPFVSDLNREERSQLARFVSAENEATADAIYQAMPTSVKVALGAKEALDGFGHGMPIGGKGSPALGVLEKNKKTHQPNQGAVGNMGEFFKQSGFGDKARNSSQKTGKIYQGQTVYKATTNINENIKKGDQFYLDAKHKDHIEVFDKKNNFNVVLNLDGSINTKKTQEAKNEGRTLSK
ncbi:hypothetical protein [Sodalis sp. dw_96]|uniref:hypothetical protein n=1 Tax=Sodalis sp. dw_96 TaxID=2719794 RepID=UPI002104D729|nr:hypothetical protein [Sodalis sp. dw_96]